MKRYRKRSVAGVAVFAAAAVTTAGLPAGTAAAQPAPAAALAARNVVVLLHDQLASTPVAAGPHRNALASAAQNQVLDGVAGPRPTHLRHS